MRRYFLAAGLFSLFLGWNMPNHYPPWASFHLELFSGIALLLLFVAVCSPGVGAGHAAPAHVQTRILRLRMPAFAWVLALLALVAPIQYLFGFFPFRGDAALGLLYALGLSLSIYVGHLWAAQQGRRTVLVGLFVAIVCGAIAANGLAQMQWLRLDVPSWWAIPMIDARPYGNLAQPNHFGLLMVLALVAAVALFEMQVLTSRAACYLLVAFFAWGVLVSQSRASVLALQAVAMCWLLTYGRLRSRLRPLEVLGALVFWWGAYLALDALQIALLLQDQTAELKDPLAAGVRPAMWRHFMAAVLAHPWLGYGFNQGVQALAESVVMLDPSGVTIATIQAHNFVLDLMVWVGVPLGLALASAVSVWMLRLTRRHVELETMRQRHWIFALWLALFVQSLVEYPYAYGYFLLPAGLLAGASVEPAGADMGALEVRRYVSSRLAWCLALIATGLLAAITYDYWRLEDDYRFTRFVKANYINQPDHEFLDTPLLLDQVAMLNSTARYVLRRDMPATEIENLKAVARRYQNTVLQLNYAKALALNGHGAQARRELQIIRGMYQNASYVAVEKQWRDWLREHPGLAGDPP